MRTKAGHPLTGGGNVVMFPGGGHCAASAIASAEDGAGRGTPSGQSPAGHSSENHCIARAARRVPISEPASSARIFFESPNARKLTVVSDTPSISAYARATASRFSMPFMDAISVSLPDVSTAILPDAPGFVTGQVTGMSLAGILLRIDERLRETGMTDNRASQLAGHTDMIRNMRRAVKNGGAGPGPRTLGDLARVLGVTRAWLLGEQDQEGAPPVDRSDLGILRGRRIVLLRELESVDHAISLIEQQHISAPKARKQKVR